MKLLGLALTVITGLLTGGWLLCRYFITNQSLDGGTGMTNPDEPMLDYLSTDWEDPCGWRVTINGCQMEIFFSDEKICQGSFSFSYSPGENVNEKTQLYPEQDRFESEDGAFAGVIQDLYTEDGMMYLDMRFDKYRQGSGSRRQVALFRTDPVNGYDPGDVFVMDGECVIQD